jgi:hypothetical protein
LAAAAVFARRRRRGSSTPREPAADLGIIDGMRRTDERIIAALQQKCLSERP